MGSTTDLQQTQQKTTPPVSRSQPSQSTPSTTSTRRRRELRTLGFEEGKQALKPEAGDPIVQKLQGTGHVRGLIDRFEGFGQVGKRGQSQDAKQPSETPDPETLQTDEQETGSETLPETDPDKHIQQTDEQAEEFRQSRITERQEELRRMRGEERPSEGYKGTGLGLALRRVVEDERFGYELDRDTDEKGFFKRHGTKGLRKTGKAMKDLGRGTKRALTSKSGAKTAGKKLGDKGVNFVPLVGAGRALGTMGKEDERVQRDERIRDDETVPQLGRQLAGGLAHSHKRERSNKIAGATFGLIGTGTSGVVGSVGKTATKTTIAMVDEGKLKKDRKQRLSARLPQGESSTTEKVDQANEALMDLTKEDPEFSKELVEHLAEKPALKVSEELALGRERQGDGEDALLKPSGMVAFGRSEGARLKLREELGAGPDWHGGSEKERDVQSKKEHKELDKRLKKDGSKDVKSQLNKRLGKEVSGIQKEFEQQRKRLAPQARKAREQLRKQAEVEKKRLDDQLAIELESLDVEERRERLNVSRELAGETAGLQDKRGRFRRKVTRNPKKQYAKKRLGGVGKRFKERRKALKKRFSDEKNAVAKRLAGQIRQNRLGVRREWGLLEKQQQKRIAEKRDEYGKLKRFLVGEDMTTKKYRRPKTEGGSGATERNVLRELYENEQTKGWEKH